MQTTARSPWKEILLGLLSLLSLLFFWGLAFLLLLGGLIQALDPLTKSDAPQSFILVVMFGIQGLVLLPGMWFLYRKATDRPEPERTVGLPFSLWHIPFLLAVWALGLLGGQWAVSAPEPAWLLLPFLIPLCVVPPIWLAVNLAARGYDFRPRWRGWVTMTIGSTIGPFVIFVLEILLILAIIIGVVVFVVLQPEMSAQLQELSYQLNRAATPDQVLALIAPLVTHPLFVGGLLLFVSVIVPMIEELLKPLTVWLFANRLAGARDGFVFGALSGAAYALFETGMLGSMAGEDWLVVLGARGGTSLLHITTSAMMGAAIVGAVRERGYARLAVVYLASIFLHGAWNAFSILTSLGDAAALIDPGSALVILGKIAPFGLGAMAVILIAIVVLLQRRYRNMVR